MATLTVDQIADMVRQLPDRDRHNLFERLLDTEWPVWSDVARYGDARAREVAAEQGLNWEQMSEEARERFVDDLVHKAR